VRFALVALLSCAACRFEFDAHTSDGSVRDTAVIDSARDAYYDAVMASHPVAYWRLGDIGEVAKDELAAHDAMLTGGIDEARPGALTGNPNTAIAFDGNDGQGRTVGGISFPNQQPFTIEIWVAEPDAAKYWHYLTCETRATGMPQQGYALLQTGGGVMFERIASPAYYDQTGTATIQVNTWTQVAGVYDGATVTLYVDGTARQSAPATETADPFDSPVFLGAQSEGAFFAGTLDEAAIYDHVLTPADLLKHYEIATGP